MMFSGMTKQVIVEVVKSKAEAKKTPKKGTYKKVVEEMPEDEKSFYSSESDDVF